MLTVRKHAITKGSRFMRDTGRRAALLAALMSVLACGPSNGEARTGAQAGAPGIGDTDFPTDGNGGYDVAHYALKLGYTPASKKLDGEATIRATATMPLSRFNL